ncbi:MAG TPA: type II toxin-antitoxin system prevent-host-death family antitoxin [Actinomycetales bacterium]|nr:type II toxin-antitoxin system prevent-host-death family antitoxin [Actinomycetales bacterium]
MESVGVRELRQHASRWLERVRLGESFEVTDRGRPVALLTPLPAASAWDRLVAAGEVAPATGRVLDVEPLAPEAGSPSASEILREMRETGRW